MDKQTTITAADGQMPAFIFHPDGPGPWSAVILYMDGIGIRPALMDMARRIAARGYYVLLPDLYYRQGPWSTLSPADAFREGPGRDRMLRAMGQLTNAGVASDSHALLDFLRRQDEVLGTGVCCVGYCMGGAHVLTAAATYPDSVIAACIFHSARLVTDRPDSPHLLLPRIRAKIYAGVAGIDPLLAPKEMEQFEEALVNAGTDFTVETYAGAKHGFAVTDTPAYNRDASERHWAKLLSALDSAQKTGFTATASS